MMVCTWILVVAVAIASIGGIAYTWRNGIYEYDKVKSKKAIRNNVFKSILYLISAVVLIFGLLFWLYGTESGSRAIKSFETNTQGGIERSVSVYDALGNEIQYYEGKFDVEHIDDKVMFDDENGKRHIIYYTTGTVIVDEK